MTRPCTALSLAALIWTCVPQIVAGQVPRCTGDDPETARAAQAEGTELMEQAIADARRSGDRARALAAQALAHFDRQCRAGDPDALMERGAALMLMGDALRSAQSYDAFLRARPLRSLDPSTRRIVESNLQLGEAIIEIDRGTGRLFVDGLDFGRLPRSTVVHLPVGEHHFEVRAADNTPLVEHTATLASGGDATAIRFELLEPRDDPTTAPLNLSRWYITAGVITAASLAIGAVFLAIVQEREATLDQFCYPGHPPTEGCEAVVTERDAALGTSVAGFVLAGIGAVSLGVVIAIDLGQPSARTAITLRREPAGASLGVSHRF